MRALRFGGDHRGVTITGGTSGSGDLEQRLGAHEENAPELVAAAAPVVAEAAPVLHIVEPPPVPLFVAPASVPTVSLPPPPIVRPRRSRRPWAVAVVVVAALAAMGAADVAWHRHTHHHPTPAQVQRP